MADASETSSTAVAGCRNASKAAKAANGEQEILDDDLDAAAVDLELAKAEVCVRHKRYERARRHLREAVRRALQLLRDLDGDGPAATALAQKARARRGAVQALVRLGVFYLDRGHAPLAAKALEKAREVANLDSAAEDDALSEGTTVSAAAAGSEGGKNSGQSARRRKVSVKTSSLGRTVTPPLSPSTPAVTDEVDGAVASGRGASTGVSKKRGGGVLGAPVAKKRRSNMSSGRSVDNDTSSSGSGYGNGGGLDLLAMLYSAAVTYETSVVAAGAGMKSFPAELYA